MVQTIVKSDAEIQRDVLRELAWDSHVEETEVGVTVAHAIVTLTGTVSSYAKRLAAQEAAHRVHGVLDVANDLVVKVPGLGTPTDTELAQAVRTALELDVLVPHEDIQTTVTDGWVTLEGRVTRVREREDAEHAVRRIAGLRGITNALAVSTPHVEPREVQAAIEEALERRADREAQRISVAVNEGTVTLSGRVRTWPEKQAVLGAAGHAPGVRVVDDQLLIDPTA